MVAYVRVVYMRVYTGHCTYEVPKKRINTGRGESMKINSCKCGSDNVEFVKLYEKNRYDGFMRCNDCGCEGRCYTSKQSAVKAWNKKGGAE